MSNERKTRNQKKRDVKRTAFMALALALLWMLLTCLMVKAWADEEPINGVEYLESIGGDPYERFQD